MSGLLEGETALVTGAGRGIGRAIAEALAANGARVALMARTTKQVDEVAQTIASAGGEALAVAGDVTKVADVQQAVAAARERLGAVSVLVSNAGITGPFAPVWDADPDEWWRTQEVHIHGAFLCTRAVWPGMVERGSGRIIIISSRAAERGNPNGSAYGLAKAAQLRLAECLAGEGAGSGIRVWAVHPGFVDTQFALEPLEREDAQKYAAPFVARLRELRKDPSLGTPVQRVADLSVFLASGQGDALSGRYFRAEEEWAEMAGCAEQIKRDDLYTLRVRTLAEPGGPPPPPVAPDH